MTYYTADNPNHIGTIVTLNGCEQHDVKEADTGGVMGYVVRALRDINGDFVVDDHAKIVMEKVWGKVEAFPVQKVHRPGMTTKGDNQMTDTTGAQKYIDAKAFDTAAFSMKLTVKPPLEGAK